MQLDAIADLVVLTIKSALAPVIERLAAAEARLETVPDIRERLAAVETKAAHDGRVEAVLPHAVLERLAAFDAEVGKATALEQSLTDLRERFGAAEARLSGLGTVCERMAAVETKCDGIMPAAPASASDELARRLFDALEKLAALEYAMNRAAEHETMIGDLKARLAVAEALGAQYQDLAALARAMAERISVLESADAPAPDVALVESVREALTRIGAIEAVTKAANTADAVTALRDRVRALEVTIEAPAAPDPVVAECRERLAVLETKAAAPAEPHQALVARILSLEQRAMDDPALKAVGDLRERVAVVEDRAPVPGPAGPAGAPGKDGADGLGFDDLMTEQRDDRSITIKAARGERVKEIGTARFPVLIQRGVYIDGKAYDNGDVVTWGGSQWGCNEPTTTKPGEGLKAWTLIVKRGRDGKDGKDAPGALPVVSIVGRSQ
jgi:hypothetical protein